MEWSTIIFTGRVEKTNPLMFRDRSYMLLPSPGQENIFQVDSIGEMRYFYIGSSSASGLRTMERFYSLMYMCSVEPSSDPGIKQRNLTFYNSLMNWRRKAFYSPGFMKSLIDIPFFFGNVESSYRISLRSYRNRRRRGLSYNFTLSVSSNAEIEHMENIESFLGMKMWEIRRDHKWRMKKMSGPKRMNSSILREPYNLVNFMRVPVEDDIVLEVPGL
ncbi:hypothetical protein OXIME_001553 [Oxyplasma meridianum]|uniref:Uncharacterized protein n=1 Tax=Oxyplasma meridianum TaxID=3073602 RepID=A0AAX4NHN2_9ARCH